MPRMPAVTRDQIRPEDLADYDETFRIREGRISTYMNVLYSPKLALRITAINDFFPDFSVLHEEPPGRRPRRGKLMEVAILIAGREINCQYAFSVHVHSAREEAKLSEDTIQAIFEKRAPEGLHGDEELVARYTVELLRNRKISDSTFNAVKDRFGPQWTVELTGLICFYVMFGHMLLAFEQEVPPGVTPLLPE